MSGISRLFDFLGSKDSFPIPVRAAACVSGMKDWEVIGIIKQSSEWTGYQVKDNAIFLKEEKHVG